MNTKETETEEQQEPCDCERCPCDTEDCPDCPCC
jgi:hypothetical protein